MAAPGQSTNPNMPSFAPLKKVKIWDTTMNNMAREVTEDVAKSLLIGDRYTDVEPKSEEEVATTADNLKSSEQPVGAVTDTSSTLQSGAEAAPPESPTTSTENFVSQPQQANES